MRGCDITMYIFIVLAARNLCPFYGGILSRECSLRDGPLYFIIVTLDFVYHLRAAGAPIFEGAAKYFVGTR